MNILSINNKRLSTINIFLLMVLLFIQLIGNPTFAQKRKSLDVDKAFVASITQVNDKSITIHIEIAPNYYLYRDRLFSVQSNNDNVVITNVIKSKGIEKEDPFFGKQQIWYGGKNSAEIEVFYTKPKEIQETELVLKYQGCHDEILCYPPQKITFAVDFVFETAEKKVPIKKTNKFLENLKNKQQLFNKNNKDSALNKSVEKNIINKTDDTSTLTKVLKENLWAGVGLLLLAGIALSFTPCVLPMLPILLGIITNQRKVSKPRSFILSSAYALGIAVMMAIFGLVVAKTGINMQIIFQKPLWLIIFASIFILMGLAMMGLFNLAMPNTVQSKIIVWQNKFQDSNIVSVFIVGALSTLVVGPCVAPPLIAILAFISTTGDNVLGSLYLFALGLGMGIPLIIFATMITTIPKTGAVSKLITKLFAMLMFGVGLWLISRLLSGNITLLLWGIFMLFVAWIFSTSDFTKNYAKVMVKLLAVLFFITGIVWIIGGIQGNSNPLKPFTKVEKLQFITITDRQSLQQELKNSDKPVLLDFYADWCVSCQEIEQFTFTDTRVVKQLKNITLLKVNMTNVTNEHNILLQEFDLVGPPALLFFDKNQELKGLRTIGTITPEKLLEKIEKLNSYSK